MVYCKRSKVRKKQICIYLNDIEIIIKGRDKEYFETLYIRKDKIDIVREIKDISKLMYSYKINDKYYINVGEELIQSVINGLDLSWLIELALKKELDNSNNYAINRLIEINMKSLMVRFYLSSPA